MKFSQGDYRRFCALFYMLTRKLILMCEQLVLRENKKRIMPRHLMLAAYLSGIIPYDYLQNQPALSKEDLATIDRAIPRPVRKQQINN